MPPTSATPDPPTDPPVFVPSLLDAWPSEDEEELLELTEFGRRIKRTPRQVHNLCDAGLPVRMRGDRRFVAWPRGLHWVIERRVEDRVAKELAKRRPAAAAAGDLDGIDALELLQAGAREQIANALEAEAKAEKAVIAVQQQRGELVAIDFMTRALEDRLRPIRAALQNLPGRWQAQFVELSTVRAARQQLERLARDTARLLAGTGTPAGIAAAEDPETPIGPDDTRPGTPVAPDSAVTTPSPDPVPAKTPAKAARPATTKRAAKPAAQPAAPATRRHP